MDPKPNPAHYLNWLQLIWEALADEDPESRESKLRVARLFLGAQSTPTAQP